MKLFTNEQIQKLQSQWKTPEEKLLSGQNPILEMRFGINNCPLLFPIALSPDAKTVFGYFMDDIHGLAYIGYYVIDEIVKDADISYPEIKIIECDSEMVDFVMSIAN